MLGPVFRERIARCVGDEYSMYCTYHDGSSLASNSPKPLTRDLECLLLHCRYFAETSQDMRWALSMAGTRAPVSVYLT